MPEPSESWRATLAALWEQQSRWSSAADIYKSSLRSWNGPLIVVGFVGVVLSTVSPYLVPQATKPDDWTRWQIVLAVGGPVLVAIAALLTRELLGPKNEQKWIKAREVSEALEAEGWMVAAGAPPYSNPETAPELLLAKMTAVKTGTEALGPLPPARTPRDDKPHDPLAVQQYIAQRVKAQCTHHDERARDYVRALARWRAVVVALTVVSAALGIIAGIGKHASINAWVAVVSTALATVTAYVTASRFEFLAATYAATSERLDSLATTWTAKQNRTAAERDRFILDCEAVLAAQNRTWAAELSKRVIDRLNALAQPQAASPPAARPEAARPEAARPEAARPEAARPEAARPGAAPLPGTPPPATPPPGPAGGQGH